MKELFTGIYNLFNAGNTFKTAVGGQMYLHEAPQDVATFPYAVYTMIVGLSDWTFTESTEETLMQFSIFSESRSATEVTEAFTKMMTLFDDAILTVVGYDHVYMHREASRLIRDSLSNTWHYSADYRILLEKAR